MCLLVTACRTAVPAYAPLPADDPVRRRPDISLAKSELDWEPKVPLQEGLRETVEYFRRRLGEA